MSKKAGILTWHYLDNYGSVLQAYALQKVLQKNKIDTKIINYRENAKIGFIYDMMRFFKYNLPSVNLVNQRKSKFYKFRKKYFKETKMYNSYEQLINQNFDYDFVVCGSDQIWSQKRFDDIYFFSFLNDCNIKKYSYAASTIEEYSLEQQEKIKKYLKEFTKISVRERKGIEIIQKYIEKNVEEVLDPTLLLDCNDWKSIIEKKDYNIIPKKKYLVCYFIGQDNKYEKLTNYIKNEYMCDEIINIEITGIHNFGNILKSVSPTEFINLILNSEVVVTDSYHGTLFAINLNKEFIAVKRFEDDRVDNQNERLYNILTKLNLIDRYFSAFEYKKDIKKIDYSKVKYDLQPYLDSSFNFIKSMLGDENND